MNINQSLALSTDVSEMSNTESTIDVYFDFSCPWCFIGHHQIADAIQRNNIDPSRIHYRAFQLNPRLPDAGIPRRTYRTQKFGTWEESQRRDEIVIAAAENNGLSINFDNITVTPNTRHAHRALKIAMQKMNDASAFIDRIFRAYFENRQDIGDSKTLINLGSEIGIEFTPEDFEIDTQGIDKAIDKDIATARRTGLTGVPHIVARNGNERNAISVTTAIEMIRESGKA